MRSAQPTQRPSAPSTKAEAVSAAPVQHLTASGGQSIRLSPREGQWQAQVTERIGHAQRQVVLPVVCAPDCEVAAQLLHVARQGLAEFVYVGRQGLLGGMIPGVEEHKEVFHQEQSAPRGSLLKLRPSEYKGPTEFKLVQIGVLKLKEAIEEKYRILRRSGVPSQAKGP